MSWSLLTNFEIRSFHKHSVYEFGQKISYNTRIVKCYVNNPKYRSGQRSNQPSLNNDYNLEKGLSFTFG